MLRSTAQTCHSTRGSSVAREAAALRDTCRLPQHGLLCVQAASIRRPRDADLSTKPDEATVEPEPGEGAHRNKADTHKDREPAARAALTTKVTGTKDAGRGAAQLPDGRQRLGRHSQNAATRHAPIIRLRRL